MPEDYKALVTRLRAEREMSLEDLAFDARTHAKAHGHKDSVSLSLIQKRLAPGSTAQPSIELLESLAYALKVEPDVFWEYRLADARRMLDDRAVGQATAIANLLAIEDALHDTGEAPLIASVEIIERHDQITIGSLQLKSVVWGIDTPDLIVYVNGKPANDEISEAARVLIIEAKAATPRSAEELIQSTLDEVQQSADQALGQLAPESPIDDESQPPLNELEKRRRNRGSNDQHRGA